MISVFDPSRARRARRLALAVVTLACSPRLLPADPPAAPPAPLAGIVAADDHERYLLEHPDDTAGLAERAMLLSHRATVAAHQDAQAFRRKARAFALAAIQAGSNDALMPMLAESIHEDGTLVPVVHSSHPEANVLVTRGEEKFARHDLEAALADYTKAWQLDPKSARIALFIGDVYFADKRYPPAIEWFDRAIVLEPRSETAHRYRADALMRLRRWDEARDGYIAAVMAEPYRRIPRDMLQRWASERRHPWRVADTSSLRGEITVEKDGFAIGYDEKRGPLSLAYLLARLAFNEEQKRTPANYRHSLDEEAHALRRTLQIAAELRASPDAVKEVTPHDQTLTLLRQLDADGLLEAHILLDRADAGIAQDYQAYREQQADRIRRYITTVWLDGAKTKP